MKTGTKCRLKYMPEDKQDCIIDVVDGNLAYIRFLNFLNTNYSFPVPLSELEPIIEWPKTWEELDLSSGWEIEADGGIYWVGGTIGGATFATKAQVESALAFAQLSQLHKQIVGDWVADWSNKIHGKFVVEVCGGLHVIEMFSTKYHLAFQTREQAEFSLTHHRELWEKYWML
jgi:hypothetical protein